MPSAGDQPSAPAGESRHLLLEKYGYHVIKRLGRGSFATVHLAYSDADKTNVAVKIISKRDVTEEYIEKFLPREISIVKTLKHPNLVIFLQVSQYNHILRGTPGPDLQNILR